MLIAGKTVGAGTAVAMAWTVRGGGAPRAPPPPAASAAATAITTTSSATVAAAAMARVTTAGTVPAVMPGARLTTTTTIVAVGDGDPDLLRMSVVVEGVGKAAGRAGAGTTTMPSTPGDVVELLLRNVNGGGRRKMSVLLILSLLWSIPHHLMPLKREARMGLLTVMPLLQMSMPSPPPLLL